MRPITRQQRESLHTVYQRFYNHPDEMRREQAPATYRQFRRRVGFETYGDAIMVECAGMWIGIEPDGYTHT